MERRQELLPETKKYMESLGDKAVASAPIGPETDMISYTDDLGNIIKVIYTPTGIKDITPLDKPLSL